jgi:hypothetical protein
MLAAFAAKPLRLKQKAALVAIDVANAENIPCMQL